MAVMEIQGGVHKEEQPPLPPFPPLPEEPPPPQMAYVREPIAPSLGVDYPFPPHLEYAYPPPDGNILTNVVNALIAVPRFYTQVLHLMNKMNLPAPFRPALPTPPLPPLHAPEPPPAPPQYPGGGDLSSGESELESSDEDEQADKTNRAEAQSEKQLERPRKRMKRAPVLGPAADKEASHEAAGVKSVTLTSKEAPTVKKKHRVLQINIAMRGIVGDASQEIGKGIIAGSPVDAPAEVKVEQPTVATREELQAGKVPPSELLTLPIFKNYTPGNPTQVLYVKNLAKDVTVEDLYYIFGVFFVDVEEAKTALTVKLMQEGRMRGQAFITFPSTELAADALNATNGFLLKGKPMIVQFGRNPSAAKTTTA